MIYNSTRFEQTQHESHTDPLTGMPNRRSLDRQLEAGLERAARIRRQRHRRGPRPRSPEGDQRHLRPRGRRPRAARRRQRAARRRSARAISARGSAATSSSWCCGIACRNTRRGASPTCRTRWRRIRSSRGPASACRCRSAPARRRFPEDGSTFEELLAAGDERMYRDKAGRRSRNSAGRHALAHSERA